MDKVKVLLYSCSITLSVSTADTIKFSYWHAPFLKTGLNEFPLFKTKRIKGYSYASLILENIKKNICARLIDDFDAEKDF